MREIVYVTGNARKFEVAKNQLRGTDVSLVHQSLETPEIQSADVNEIAAFSAKWASEKMQKPVAVTDAGYYIEALNGFPGPFIKYVNQWLSAEDILRLMEGKENRNIEVKACLAYCEPKGEPVLFNDSFCGRIALQPGRKGTTPINEIFIPNGFDVPESEIPWEKMISFWASDDTWQRLINHLLDKP